MNTETTQHPEPLQGVPVSVVIITYNRAGHLRRCLDALARQTYRNFEVVVVMGPCTDHTAAVLEMFAGSITIARTDRRIIGVSRNAGIEQSRGALVAFIDDDAVPSPEWLANLVAAFDDADIGAVGGTVFRMRDGGIEWRNGVLDRDGILYPNCAKPGEYQRFQKGRLNTVSGNCCMFRRRALEEVGGFDEEIAYMYDECDVVQRIERAGYRIVHQPTAIVEHESARSVVRSNHVDYDWFTICKYHAYGALKNAQGCRAWTVARVTWRLAKRWMCELLSWWSRGLIGWSQLLRSERDCARGIAAGLRKGWSPRPVYRVILPCPGGEPIRPFRQIPESTLSVCLLCESTPERNPDGIATYTFALAKALFEHGCRVHVISLGEADRSELVEGIWRHWVKPSKLGARFYLEPQFPVVAKNIGYAAAVWRKVRELDERHGIDIVEASSWNIEGLVIALDGRIPFVVHVHTALFQAIEAQGWAENDDLRLSVDLEERQSLLADEVITSTRAAARSIVAKYRSRPAHMGIVPLGLDLQGVFRPSQPGVARRVLFVGRLEPRKGIGTLLDAIPRVIDCIPGAEFDIVGKDVMSVDSPVPQWRKAHRGLQKHVRFHGEVPRAVLDDLYERCDLLAGPSRYESFGLTFVEAMARGKAIVGTTGGGIPEVVQDGETGLLVAPDDPAALSEAIVSLLRDDEYRQRLGRAGYGRYQSEFTAWRMAGRMLAIYREVIARRRAQKPSEASTPEKRRAAASFE